MTKRKNNNFIEVFKIFFSSIKTYFMYLDQCSKYLAYPIFGQLISIYLLFAITYYFNKNVDHIRALYPLLQDDNTLLISFFVVLTPLFYILIQTVYRYIIAFESLNILFSTVSHFKKNKKVDFALNDRAVERRLFGYILLMLIVTFLLITPPLVLFAPITWIFLCLTFQVHTLENNTSPFDAVSRSVKLVKNNIIPTIIMIILCYVTTYWFLTELAIWALDKISVTHFFINLFIPFIELLPINEYNAILQGIYTIDSVTIAKGIVEGSISFIIIGFTLPFRCCCFTNLYRLYDSEQIKEYSKESDEIIKRATGKKR